MMTLGLYVRPWIKVSYPDIPAVGSDRVDSVRSGALEAGVPQPAFENARPEDRFWAARIVAALPDDGVRAVVDTAKYSDPKATEYLADTMLARKNKVLKAWLNGTNPVVNPALSPAGELTFENAAHKAGVGPRRRALHDSVVVVRQRVEYAQGCRRRADRDLARRPGSLALLSARPEYIAALVRALPCRSPGVVTTADGLFPPHWDNWSLVGLERIDRVRSCVRAA